MEQMVFRAMGSTVTAMVEAPCERLGAVPAWFEEWEQHLSRFRPTSELMRLNAAPGEGRAISPLLWEVLQVALDAARWSDGLVVPSLYEAMIAAGYDRSFESLDAGADGGLRAGVAEALAAAVGAQEAAVAREYPVPSEMRRLQMAGVDWRSIRCLAHGRRVWLPPHVRLDLGGIAKGWAADQAVARLAAGDSQGGARGAAALLDAGGDIAVSGPRADGTGWPIGMPHPFHPEELIATLWLAGGGVATSGRDYRRWRSAGQEQHHLIDPRTGRSAVTDVISATVIGPSASAAEVAAKAALLLGGAAGIDWIDQRPVFAGALILSDGSVLESRRFDDYRWPGTERTFAQ